MMMTSSFGCVCGACVVRPGGTDVMCISSSSSVAVGERSTAFDMPLLPLGRAWLSSQLIAVEPRMGSCADATPPTNVSAKSAGASPRVVMIVPPRFAAGLILAAPGATALALLGRVGRLVLGQVRLGHLQVCGQPFGARRQLALQLQEAALGPVL